MRIDDCSVGQSNEARKKDLANSLGHNPANLIRASGIPWIATKQEIVDFFGDIKILNGVQGIHFIIDKIKNSRNDAFIQLASKKHYELAMKQTTMRMGSSSVKCVFIFFLVLLST